ncbi:MAG: 4Fe-4S dicluster domain-containing protein [Thiolinea sp.]
MSSVFLSNTNHEEDQPVHLQLKDPGQGFVCQSGAIRWPGATLLPGRCV